MHMTDPETPTVERSLQALSEAVGKASDDLRAVRATIDRARADIATHNTSLSRAIVKDAQRVIDHLRQTDKYLSDVLKHLGERD
jgi:ABC-type transporter Mla subunit MlaD